jgi:hypothetical protein
MEFADDKKTMVKEFFNNSQSCIFKIILQTYKGRAGLSRGFFRYKLV